MVLAGLRTALICGALCCLIAGALPSAAQAADDAAVAAISQEWLALHVKQDMRHYHELRKEIFALDNQIKTASGALRVGLSNKRDDLLEQAVVLKARIDYYNETLKQQKINNGAAR